MVGRLDRQGTCFCRLFWDADETGKRPFETRFRLFCLPGATEETLCSSVDWLHGFVTGMNWIKVSDCDGHELDKGIERCSGIFDAVAVSLARRVRRP